MLFFWYGRKRTDPGPNTSFPSLWQLDCKPLLSHKHYSQFTDPILPAILPANWPILTPFRARLRFTNLTVQEPLQTVTSFYIPFPVSHKGVQSSTDSRGDEQDNSPSSCKLTLHCQPLFSLFQTVITRSLYFTTALFLRASIEGCCQKRSGNPNLPSPPDFSSPHACCLLWVHPFPASSWSHFWKLSLPADIPW